MKITDIEIKNFRAFPKTYHINLHNVGKNLLVYGENGSGKSSLYLALKYFLESAVNENNEDNKNTDFEVIMKRLCEKENVRVRYRENPKDLTSNDFWIPITQRKKGGQNVINQTLKNKVESTRKFTLNELSHASVANIYRKELEDAINAVEQLEVALA